MKALVAGSCLTHPLRLWSTAFKRMHSVQMIPHIISAIRITGSNPESGACAGCDA